MGATFIAARQTLIDPVTIGLVFDDEDAAVGRCRRRSKQKHTGQKRREESHAAPLNERTPLTR